MKALVRFCLGPPAEDVTDVLFKEVDWPRVTAAYEGATAGPPEGVLGSCVRSTLEAESSWTIEHAAIPRVILLDGVSGIISDCGC